MATSSAPLEIGQVALTVNDLPRLATFYREVIGLDDVSSDGETARFGAGGHVLLELRQDRAARRHEPRDAGLFHTAFLLPRRADLANWLRHAVDLGVRLDGASDHLVSEALYLRDPEGNGIEVYRDRDRADWPRSGGAITMATDPLDLDDLMTEAKGDWGGAPEGTVIGHVHLQVGQLPEAEAFYAETLGFPLTVRYPGASFFGAGGYHHHLAGNIWNSRGAGPRPRGATGLAEVQIRGEPAALAPIRETAGGDRLSDPWGTEFSLVDKDR